MNKQQYLDKIKKMREGETIKRDPQLIGFMVRDWDVTADAGLTDLCWAMCRDGYVHTNDATFLLDQLEAHLKQAPCKTCSGNRHIDTGAGYADCPDCAAA